MTKKKSKKELTVTVANPKTKEEYKKMIANLNLVFKKRNLKIMEE